MSGIGGEFEPETAREDEEKRNCALDEVKNLTLRREKCDFFFKFSKQIFLTLFPVKFAHS